MEVYPTNSDDGSREHSESCERWFKMPSRLWDTEVGSDPYLLQLLAYLCDRARISDGPVSFGEGRGRRNFMLAAGELIVGRLQAAKDLKCPPSTVRNRLQKLVEIGLVRVKPCKNFSVVSIVFMAQKSSKKKSPKKDSRKTSVSPANSLTNANRIDSKRTDEGQPENEQFANELPSDSSSTVHEKGQMKDRRWTDDGQMKDTNKKDEKIRRKEGERESLSPDLIFSILEDAEFAHLRDADRDQAAREIADEYQLGNVGPDSWQARLRQIARLKMSRSPKRFDIFASARSSAADPLDSVTSTLTPSASVPSVPRFVAPDLRDVEKFFEQRAGGPFAWTSATAFCVEMRSRQWKRRDGEYIDWEREAMRSKAVPVPSSPVPSSPVPSASVPSASTTSTPTTSTAATLPTAPLPSAPAKSAAEFLAELERATR
jgi:hypothetical protein